MSEEIEVVRIHVTKHERGGSCAEGALENFRGVSLNIWPNNELQGKTLQSGEE